MNQNRLPILLVLSLFAAANSLATVRYVDVNSADPTPPYASWATAATNIQAAVDAAVAGDQIIVTNGVYQTGGQVAPGIRGTTNRVLVLKAVTVQSVNGPEVTVIRGYQMPGSTNGPAAVRCVFLDNGASLSGFTLTYGATVNDDNGNVGGGVCGGTLSNCVVTGNYAYYGGGAYGSTLNNCVIAANAAGWSGGGTTASTLNNCIVSNNSALDSGGGVGGGTLNHCTVVKNASYHFGGGAWSATLNNCRLTENFSAYGGGAEESDLNNCVVLENEAGNAGGAGSSTLRNCTVVSNSASGDGAVGGVDNSTLVNCIAYYNVGPGDIIANYEDVLSTVDHTCTTPIPPNGFGNITNSPLFIDLAGGNLHLQPNSPCIDAGTNLIGVITNDLDGRPRPLDGNADGVAAFDMGAYEHAVLFVRQTNPSPAPPYNSWLSAATNIQDATDLTLAGAGDQILVTNGVYPFGGNASGRVVLSNATTTIRSMNGPQASVIDGGGAVRCVLMTNGTFLSGFTLTNGHALDSGGGVGFLGFQSDAVVSNCVIVGNSSPSAGGAGSVLMTGGFQPVGGSLINCVLSNNSATAFQPGNPTVGIGGAADNCNLNNCALVSNFAAYGGGGASASRLVNCRLTGNSANAEGGGTRWSWLYNCLLSGNSSGTGAAYSSTLVNCTLTANPSGGAYSGFLTNCIVYDNGGGGNQIGATLNYCCTTPLPGSGIGNFTNAPLFVDPAGGNFRLQTISPCINAGDSSAAPGGQDLDGRPRIVGGAVDVGAYEFQPGVSGEFIDWLSQFGLATDGSADYADSDGDSLNNWQEWIAGTVPTNAASALRLLNPAHSGSGLIVTWQSVPNRSYFLQRSSNLGAAIGFSLVASNIVGQAGTTSFTDTNATGPGPFFYRVGVQQ